MPTESEEKQKDDGGASEAYHALSVFCTKYDPATPQTATAQFSSREIQLMIEKHIGITVELHVLYALMRQMKFDYILQDGEFIWLVQELIDDNGSSPG